jgi:hypothetical protein
MTPAQLTRTSRRTPPLGTAAREGACVVTWAPIPYDGADTHGGGSPPNRSVKRQHTPHPFGGADIPRSRTSKYEAKNPLSLVPSIAVSSTRPPTRYSPLAPSGRAAPHPAPRRAFARWRGLQCGRRCARRRRPAATERALLGRIVEAERDRGASLR